MLLAILLLTTGIAHAQQKQITGQLKTASGEPIPNATILLTNTKGLIVKYGTSDNSGKYSLTLPDSASVTFLRIEVNHLGYNKVQLALTEDKTVYDFVLERKVTELPQVEVKAKPFIDRSGDTLRYNVASFSNPADRSIGDVLKHMPGISVSDNGDIFYNGQPISNLYIHGDDLMDGSYRLAPRVISKDMIKSVEVIQHDQPIKILQNKIPSDAVAINLVLKDENSVKLSGQAMLGAGLPEQYDAALNTMLFNKKIKMLNSVKANNSGIDYTDEFIRSGGSAGDPGNSRPPSLLSVGGPVPNLPRKQYYFNRSQAVNLNNLVNTKKDWQLRTNIQAFFDRNTLTYNSQQNNYLNNDTIRYNEQQNLVNNPFLVNGSFTTTVNKTHNYFTNNLRFKASGNNNNSYLNFNGAAFGQHLHDRNYDLSNLINWMPETKDNSYIQMKWFLNYYNNPQMLYIDTGLNSDILNEHLPYAAVDQQAKTPGLFSNAAISYTVGKGALKKSFEAGITNERQTLLSTLSLTQNNNAKTPYQGDAGNYLHWQRDKFYVTPSLTMIRAKWNATAALPLSWQTIHYYQDAYALNKKINRFFFNPSAQFQFKLNDEDELSLRYSYTNNMGNIAGVYRGAIMTNYLSLTANDADLQELSSSATGINYKFQRSLIMLFASAGISYNRSKANAILSSLYTNNVQRTVLLPYENDQSTWSANASLSKYLLALRTTASLKTTLTRNYSNRFINNELLPFNNDAIMFTAGLDSRFGIINFNYTGNGLWTFSRQRNKAEANTNTIRQFDQRVTMGYSPVKNLFLTVTGRHLYSTQARVADISYLFTDANARYKLTKWRMDLELDVTNLANVKKYETLNLNANQFTVSNFQLRGRMAIFRATFNL
ncbi:Outer membrane protein beta-barrel family protein [Niastella yeongjuensis]|nr:Outer membrane protein beta-barrel family protein [Niastella yeongjuensis]